MKADQIIREIDTYLSVYPIKLEKPPITFPGTQHRDLSKAVIPLNGMRLADISGRDENLEKLIEHCSEEMLEELVNTFGEDSPIANIIKRKKAEALRRRTACDYDTIQKSLEEALKQSKKSGNPFYEDVCKYMKRIGFENDSDFYNSISMPRQQFARLRDANNTLSKKTVLWIIVGLRLNYHDANDLLQKAGYFFRKNDMRDVILTYIFRNTTYDLDMVNQVLDHFGLASLC